MSEAVRIPAEAPDYADNSSTLAVLSAGGSLSAEIGVPGDRDWFRIDLTAGTPYRIDLRGASSGGGTLTDPYLRLLDASGSVIIEDDDEGEGFDSRVNFTPTTSGAYYLEARHYNSSGTGSYTIAASLASSAPPPSTPSPTPPVTPPQRDDYGDNTDTLARLSPGQSQTGVIGGTNDFDVFRITLSAGSFYRFDLVGSGGGGTLANPHLALWDSSGRTVAQNDDYNDRPASRFGRDARINFIAPASGVYYLAARSSDFLQTGSYTLSASSGTSLPAPLPAPQQDVPAELSAAATLTLNQPQLGSIGDNNDTDSFLIVLSAGTTYRFQVLDAPVGGGTLSPAYFLTLLGVDRQVISFAEGVQSVSASTQVSAGAIVFTPASSGTHYLRVSGEIFLGPELGYQHVGRGTYTILATTPSPTSPAAADDHPGNANTTGAVPVGGASTGIVDDPEDKDWFRTALTAGVAYQFDLRGSSTRGGSLIDPFLRLFNSNGELVAFDDDGGHGLDARITFTPTNGGVYYLEAGSAGAGTGAGSYTIAARFAAGAAATDDYAAGVASAGFVVAGNSVTGNVEAAGDRDWFRVSLSAGIPYQISLRGASSGGGTLRDPHLTLYNTAGDAAIAVDDDAGDGLDSRLLFTPPSSGAYYIEAAAYGAGTGTYTVVVTTSTSSVDDHPANTSSTALVSLGGTSLGSIETLGDRDWFRATLTAGTTYRIDLRGGSTRAGTLTDPRLTLYNAGGTAVLASDDDSGGGLDSRISFTPTSSGTYYLEVEGVGNRTGTYSLSLSLATAATASAADDGDASSAGRSGSREHFERALAATAPNHPDGDGNGRAPSADGNLMSMITAPPAASIDPKSSELRDLIEFVSNPPAVRGEQFAHMAQGWHDLPQVAGSGGLIGRSGLSGLSSPYDFDVSTRSHEASRTQIVFQN